MIFNSIEFLFVFLPLTLTAFYIAPRRLRLPVLLLASLLFYSFSGVLPALFMIGSILWAFGWAFIQVRWRSSWTLVGAISFPLVTLFLFRYLDFTLTTVNAGPETRDVLGLFLAVTLPAGISFYTFQIMSYSLDVAGNDVEREKSLLSLSTYLVLFPQLIAGPIVRYPEVKEQIARLATETRIPADVARGIKYLSFGLFAKIFFADAFATVTQKLYDLNVNQSWFDAVYSIFAYSMRIYYDFWSYSLMAIGLGLLIGINFPRNFREPYLATDPREFWRRWHVTLSYFIRDYIYLKLGGNQAYVRNIIIIFVVAGLWHGAGWNFVLWGIYHAALVVAYHLVRPLWDPLPKGLRIALTFILVSLGWPLFYLSLDQYVDLMTIVFYKLDFASETFRFTHWAYLAAVVVWTFLQREDRWLYDNTRKHFADSGVLHAALISSAMLFLGFRQTFIYFRF